MDTEALMWGRPEWLFVGALVVGGCTGETYGGKGGGGDDTGEPADDTGDDGGSIDEWTPAGSGLGYLLDGTTDNSLFYMELENVPMPSLGKSYYGWLSGGTEGDIYLGEIVVEAEGDLIFEADVELNALLAGYDTFEAWQGTSEDARTNGSSLWYGQIDADLKEAYLSLILSSDVTPEGEGSLRSLETTCETIIAHSEAVVAQTLEVSEIWAEAEAMSNAITGEEADLDGNGTALTIEGIMPILGEDGLVELIYDDLGVASGAVEHGHPIKDLASDAYDCVQLVDGFAEDAADWAGLASVCGEEGACDGMLEDAAAELQWALDGFDADADGEIDLATEGTIECALVYASQMAYLDVYAR